ncbi:phospholipase/carboxylesterase [Halopseudomonas xinjiangensis]|uniref:Phospholipase/carboxylesterase n=1 Tax=Halopseudomonas xinjiangensis TaxID=487184 RepID=A0A1H1VQV1_9GAMM|nr:alpha/beta fold hydrolase [Halopseudomonas xinjiangensis]SDS87132.1 phospholipase/carboxylesterase [Halopseudomonas xinjiangensis]
MSQNPLIIDPPATTDACVVVLHGLGADRFDFVPVVEALNLPAGHGIRFVFPQAPTRRVTINNGFPMPCWYDILGMSPARVINDDHMNESAAMVRQLVDAQVAQGIAEERIILAGFSQGGAVVLHAMLEGELRIGGLAALSTYGPTVPELIGRQGPDAPELDVFFAHGRNDDVLPISMGREAHDQLQAAGHRTEWHEYPMGHEVCPAEVSDIREWLTKRLSH